MLETLPEATEATEKTVINNIAKLLARVSNVVLYYNINIFFPIDIDNIPKTFARVRLLPRLLFTLAVLPFSGFNAEMGHGSPLRHCLFRAC